MNENQQKIEVAEQSDTSVLVETGDPNINDGTPHDSMNWPNERVAGFNSLVTIAEGASGVVYSARRNTDGKAVAIKIYKKEMTPNPDAVRRFKKEIDTLSKLSHPNIVKILDFGTTSEDESFIAMELVEGSSLRALLDSEGVFEPRRAATIAREMCRALNAVHSHGVIHRDLKPNNVIVDSNNVAKIVDFGIAKTVSGTNDTITQFGAVIGTPAYMSPEQCLGQKVDERSDVYSLGCTLFEMLTGTKAFESSTAMEALAKQIDSDRANIRKFLVSANADPSLQTIVMKCLDREPDKRYKTTSELDHDLSAYLLGVPLGGAQSGKQHLSWFATLVLCICALLVVLMTTEILLFGARTTLENKAPEKVQTINSSRPIAPPPTPTPVGQAPFKFPEPRMNYSRYYPPQYPQHPPRMPMIPRRQRPDPISPRNQY